MAGIAASEDCREPLVVWGGEAAKKIWVSKSVEAMIGRMGRGEGVGRVRG